MDRPNPSHWPLQLLLGWVNFAMTAPLIYLYLGLPLVMRQHGWSGTEIGLFQLAGLPAVLKFVLGAPVDRWARGAPGYRRWSLVLMAGYAASLVGLACLGIEQAGFVPLFVLAMLASLLGTWADAPVNVLAIRCLPAEERQRAGIIRSAASSLGAVVGGGVMLMLQARAGWAWPFWALSGGLLLAALGLWLIPRATLAQADDVQARQVGVGQWLAYFSNAERHRWVVMLMLYFPFIGAAWVYLKPLLLDQGLPPEQVALVAGVLGGVVGAVGSALGGHLARRSGLQRALPACALAGVAALGALAGTVASGAGVPWLVACTLLLALVMGASAGLLFGMMMNHTRAGLTAVDYGLQSSLFVLTRTLVPMLAGILLDRLGYLGMLAGLILCMAGVWAWSRRFVRHGQDLAERLPAQAVP
ncbi:MFS transporter [Metapseudomonas otitidis]|uniref:MFS transporter n=2 Tax=Metapseudomonas otitidis TaxID=319939 RepID=UPI00244D635A|nr:MFS transporter [Pseudomonas otitidis]MDH1109839.1 MFS transporter [Pseudomonas otitidis]MDH1167736.1 MFS transporter [Pseudomonas otitidis]